MSFTMQLLKQVRNVAAKVNRTTGNDEHRHLLTAADVLFNELMLRESPDFYVEHIARGKVLFDEGCSLLVKLRRQVPSGTAPEFAAGAAPRNDDLDKALAQLNSRLVSLVQALDENRSREERDYMVRLGDWENALYHHRAEAAPWQEIDNDDVTEGRLLRYLERRFPTWSGLKLVAFAPLSGGFSKKTFLFETEDAINGRQAMVMRAEQSTNLLAYDGCDVTKEFHSIQLMRRAGLPVAEPLWLEDDPNQLGMRFIVSKRARGSTRGGNMGSDDVVSEKLMNSMMSNFVRMHRIRLDPNDPLVQKSHFREWTEFKTVSDAIRHCATTFARGLIAKTGIDLTPQLARTLSWLERNVPQVDEPPVIVHIDYAFNNLIIDDDEVTAILDWESSRLGDPADDIIWTQYCLVPYLSMGDFLKRYRQETGRNISAYRIAYARVLKCLLNAITCLSALRALDKDDTAHPVLGTLGLKYMAVFGSEFNALIDEAERLR